MSWCAAAERITRLSRIAAFFCLNGLILFAAGRPGGQKDARALMLPDALLAGAPRLAAVLPGLSPRGLTLAVCRLRDLRTDFALRFTAMLTLGLENSSSFAMSMERTRPLRSLSTRMVSR